MAIIRGGARHSWVYFDADLVEQQSAAHARGDQFEFRRTDEQVPHPDHPEFLCQVWQWVNPHRRSLRQESA